MHDDETRRGPGPAHFVGSAILAVVFLFLIALTLPSLQSSSLPNDYLDSRRRRGVIFIIDTTDNFDAHGAHVHSVVRQYCPDCEVRQVNLHGDISIPSILQALQQVREIWRGFDVETSTLINLSLGTYTDDPILHTLIRQLTSAGAVVIASAGNDNLSTPFYPAAFEEVLAVCSSSRYRKTKASYSNFGPWVGLCAPGLHYVTRPLHPVGIASGTSFASPMVTGVLGQLLLDAPCVSARIGVRALLRTADPIEGNRHQLGAGLLNAAAAAHYLKTLYSCDSEVGMAQRLIRRFRRLGTDMAVMLGLVAYAIVSIFAIPFLFAFFIERWERRLLRQRQQRVRFVYTCSPEERRERLLVLRSRSQRRDRVRRGDRDEVVALLHAMALYAEPCGWCDRPDADFQTDELLTEMSEGCSRCGLGFDDLVSF